MKDTTPLVNNLAISGQYLGGSLSVIRLDSTATIQTSLVDSVGIWYGEVPTPNFSDQVYTKWFTTPVVQNGSGHFSDTVTDAQLFAGVQDTIYCAVVVRGKGGVISKTVESMFVAGSPRPSNPVALSATAATPSSIILGWNSLAGLGIDSLRIYYDTVQIPLSFQVTGHGAPRVENVSAVLDTVVGLNSSTKYYFGAQICKGGLWSAITVQSSAFATTQQGDTSHIINTITISSISFDSAANTIVTAWSVPSQGSIQYWCATYSLDPANMLQPSKGALFTSVNDTARDTLGGSIVFDTTYYVWLWVKSSTGAWTAPGVAGRMSVARRHIPGRVSAIFRPIR